MSVFTLLAPNKCNFYFQLRYPVFKWVHNPFAHICYNYFLCMVHTTSLYYIIFLCINVNLIYCKRGSSVWLIFLVTRYLPNFFVFRSILLVEPIKLLLSPRVCLSYYSGRGINWHRQNCKRRYFCWNKLVIMSITTYPKSTKIGPR